MGELINLQGENKMMSSKQIANRTGKEHKNVIRDINVMIQELEIDGSKLSHLDYQLIKDNREYTSEIFLNEELTLCLATGYSAKLRMMLIKDWQELKINSKPSYESALEIMGVEKDLIPQIAKVYYERDSMKPKMIAFENVIDNANTYTLDSASDVLNIGRNNLAKILEAKKWKTVREKNGTSSTRYAEENGYAKTIYEYIKINSKDIKTKRFVLKKKGLDKLINEQTKLS